MEECSIPSSLQIAAACPVCLSRTPVPMTIGMIRGCLSYFRLCIIIHIKSPRLDKKHQVIASAGEESGVGGEALVP